MDYETGKNFERINDRLEFIEHVLSDAGLLEKWKKKAEQLTESEQP
jgi:hypothetical protein